MYVLWMELSARVDNFEVNHQKYDILMINNLRMDSLRLASLDEESNKLILSEQPTKSTQTPFREEYTSYCAFDRGSIFSIPSYNLHLAHKAIFSKLLFGAHFPFNEAIGTNLLISMHAIIKPNTNILINS